MVEIVSPESATRDREDKVIECAQAGVPGYWLVDPLLKRIVVYVLGADATYQIATPDAEDRLLSTVLPGFKLSECNPCMRDTVEINCTPRRVSSVPR